MPKADKIMQEIKDIVDRSECMVVVTVVADGEMRSTVYGHGSVDEIALATELVVQTANECLTKVFKENAPAGIGNAPKITHHPKTDYIQ